MKPFVEEEIKRILPYIPTTPPEDTLEIVQRRGYLMDERLIYGCEWVYDELEGKKVRKTKVVCTHCGGEDYREYVQSGCGRYGVKWGFKDGAGADVTDGSCCVCPYCLTGMTPQGQDQRSHIHEHPQCRGLPRDAVIRYN